MGGKAVGGRRMPFEEFFARRTRVKNFFDNENIKVYFPTELIKDDYGDIDIILHKSYSGQAAFLFSLWANSKVGTKNGNVHSFEWEGVQVDLIFVPDPEYSVRWYSYGQASAIMGRIYRHYGMKFGWDALYYNVKTKSFSKDIVITKNFDDALHVLDFKQAVGAAYFDEVLWWISLSKYVNLQALRSSKKQRKSEQQIEAEKFLMLVASSKAAPAPRIPLSKRVEILYWKARLNLKEFYNPYRRKFKKWLYLKKNSTNQSVATKMLLVTLKKLRNFSTKLRRESTRLQKTWLR